MQWERVLASLSITFLIVERQSVELRFKELMLYENAL